MRRINGLIFLLVFVLTSPGVAFGDADVADKLKEEFLPFLPTEGTGTEEPRVLEPVTRRVSAEELLAQSKRDPKPWKKFNRRTVEFLLHIPVPYTGTHVAGLLDKTGLIDSGGDDGSCRPIRLLERVQEERDEFGNLVTEERLKFKPRAQAWVPYVDKCARIGVKKLKSEEFGADGESRGKRVTGAMITIEFTF